MLFSRFFFVLFSLVHDMLFSLIIFTEQQGEPLPHLFEVFGGCHRFAAQCPKNEKKIGQLQMCVPKLLSQRLKSMFFEIFYSLRRPLQRFRRLLVSKNLKNIDFSL